MPTAGRSTTSSAASLAPSPSSSSSPTIARSAASAGVATLTSRILGVVREQVLAAMFGAGNAMDAYNVAFRIPNLVRDLFAEGAMSSAFVPTFMRHLTTNGKESAWRLGNLVINALLVITGILVVLGIVFARPLVEFFAGAYGEVPGKLELGRVTARRSHRCGHAHHSGRLPTFSGTTDSMDIATTGTPHVPERRW